MLLTVNRKIRVNGIWEAFEKKISDRDYFNDYAEGFFRLVYAVEGTFLFQNDKEVFLMKAGDAAVVRGGEISFVSNSSSKDAKALVMSFDANGMLCEKFLGIHRKMTVKSAEKLDYVLAVLKNQGADAENYINEPRVNFMHELANTLEIFLLSLTENKEEITEEKIRLSNEFKEILNIMRDNVEKPLLVKDIALLCGMSESSLKKIFSKYSSCSVHKYFLKMKIFKAIELLDNQYNVAEISEKLSFNNQNYFGVVFKKETGYSPLNYRKKFLHTS